MSNEAMVTIPPDVVRTRASSTVFVKASSLVNLDFAGMAVICRNLGKWNRCEIAELSLAAMDSTWSFQ